ncbi:cellulase-domain-containing protein [Aureobasidium pullulans]|uniref:Endoglucanase EG-II n=1 Tax=Aureobasidium pullulans TaxID=5580 RepID=A0A4V4IM17_AURPU|nr:cellulase-domain-containing protein [Aureobasidium pullulans]
MTPPTSVKLSGKVRYAGVNIAGFDFGCLQDGSCPVKSCTEFVKTFPQRSHSLTFCSPGEEGAYQMQHFVQKQGLNTFRLPVAWQYLVNAKLGGELDSINFAKYDKLVQSCLQVAELCIISIHNYGRWNGSVIGQSSGVVTNADFNSLWSQLATKYANEPKVAFGLMNEPHKLCITDWAETIQDAVTTIRKTGATQNLILLPGINHSSAGAFLYDGSATELSTVVNLDKSTKNLIFDVHIYLDKDGTGKHSECTTSNALVFTHLATWLRKEGRQAFLSETGGGNTNSCVKYMREQLQVLMNNSDVYLGWTGWAAGKFSTSYVLSETPFGKAGNYVDQLLVKEAIAGVFNSV